MGSGLAFCLLEGAFTLVFVHVISFSRCLCDAVEDARWTRGGSVREVTLIRYVRKVTHRGKCVCYAGAMKNTIEKTLQKDPFSIPPDGQHVLAPLPYDEAALEPHIDAKTMSIHHDKHHASYVSKLNDALAPHPELQSKSLNELMRTLDDVPKSIRGAVRNNGGGHLNHSLFWGLMSPNGGGVPAGPSCPPR